jgi:hypothetical protein
MDYIIYIGILLIILLAFFGEKAFMRINALIWAEEKPDKINGIRVRLGQFDGIGPNPPKQIYGIISHCANNRYRINFDEPFEYQGKKENYAVLTARHAGYPVSRMGRHSILAVNCEFESGYGCIASIAKAK